MPLIVIEGLDGAGKSTQVELLTRHFGNRGCACHYVHFPRFDAPVYGDLIARFLRGDLGDMRSVDPYLVALIYAGDRAGCKGRLQDWLRDGCCVFLDRYVYSNIAYQCAKLSDPAGRERLKQWILDMEFDHYGLPAPDRCFFLDVPFHFAAQKLQGRRDGENRGYLQGKRDIHEADLDFQRQVRQVYLSLVRDLDVIRVDCSDGNGGMLPPDVVLAGILANFDRT